MEGLDLNTMKPGQLSREARMMNIPDYQIAQAQSGDDIQDMDDMKKALIQLIQQFRRPWTARVNNNSRGGSKSKRKSIRKSRRKLSRKSIRKSKRKPKRKLSRKSNVHKRSKIRKKVMRGGGWNEVEQVWKPESRKIYIGSEGEVRGSRPVNKNDRSEMVFPHPKGSPEDDYSEKQDKARQLDLIAQLIDQRSRTPRAAAAPGSAV